LELCDGQLIWVESGSPAPSLLQDGPHTWKQGTLLEDNPNARSFLAGLSHETTIRDQGGSSLGNHQDASISGEAGQVIQVRGLRDQKVIQLRLREYRLQSPTAMSKRCFHKQIEETVVSSYLTLRGSLG
jgi:hypothetical protein